MRAERKSRELRVCAHTRAGLWQRRRKDRIYTDEQKKQVIKIQLVSPHKKLCRSVSRPLCTHLWIYCLLKAGILNLFSAWSLWSHLPSSHSEPPQWIHGFMCCLSDISLHASGEVDYIILYRVGNPPQWMIRNKSLETYETESNMWPLNPHETNIVFGTLQNPLEYCKNKSIY